MWKLYHQSKAFSQSPSERFGVDPDNAWLCWQFDNAVQALGAWVEAKLSERTAEGKPKHEIEVLLGLPRKVKRISRAYFENSRLFD